jgi:hypothetical protein
MTMRGVRAAGVLTLAAVLGTAGLAAAQGRGKQKPRQMPQTGVERVSTPADLDGEAALEQMTSRSSEGLVEVVHPDGSVSIDLQGRFMNVMLAAVLEDGSHGASCAVGNQALKLATSRPQPATGSEKRRNASAPAAPAAREIK